MNEHSEHEAQNKSFTAMVCEQAALFGATPGPDEFDNRPVWDEGEALAAVTQAFRILAQAALPDGTQLADERASLLWGLRQHPRRAGAETRPSSRQAHPRHPRTTARAGRLRDPLPRTRTQDRPGQTTSRNAGTPSSNSVTPPPRPTVPRPARSGGRGAAPTSRRPASSHRR